MTDDPFPTKRGPATPLPDADTRRRIAAASRRISHELITSTADVSELEEAAELLERAAELLEPGPHGRAYIGVAEGSLVDRRDFFAAFSPISGELNPIAPPLRVEILDDRIIADAVYDDVYEGPPGCVHGGFIAAGFDEVLGFAQALSGASGMTGRLEITYRSPTPLHRPVRYVGTLTSVEGRKILTHCTLSAGDTLCAEAVGLFITMRPEVFERLLRIRLSQD